MRKRRGTGRQDIIRQMRVWAWMAAGIVGLGSLAAAGCSNPLGVEYEYDEQLYLGTNGSADLVINASIPAFVALRGLPLNPDPSVPVDRDQVRQAFSDPGCGEVTVNRPWMRNGRRFVQVVLEQNHVGNFATCGPVSWSTYSFVRSTGEGGVDEVHYSQVVGPPTAGDPGPVNWTGEELVGFKIHAPSTVLYHNVRRLEDGEPGDAERGNILTWEQTLADRRAGRLLHLDVRMLAQSILTRTLLLFVGSFLAAVLVLIVAIWYVLRRAKKRGPLGGRVSPPPA
jgi:hypothetical protein